MTSVDLHEFRRLVEAKKRNEIACAEALKGFARVLLPSGRHEMYEAGSEITTRRGRCDLVVLAEEYVSSKESKRVAYVWELKAPQCCIFIRDGKERACPSKDLYSAENQLLHYLKCLRCDGVWKEQKRILGDQDIRLGGIVIGRELTSMDDGFAELARSAKEIRKEFFYCDRLRLLDWDEVLWHVENLPNTRRQISGNIDGDVSVGDAMNTSVAANKALQRTALARRR